MILFVFCVFSIDLIVKLNVHYIYPSAADLFLTWYLKCAGIGQNNLTALTLMHY